MRTSFAVPILIVVMALIATACGGGDDDVTVEDAWGRPSPMQAGNAAFYMQITGGSTDDTLVSASSEACGTTELHETVMNDGVMSMHRLSEGLEVPAGETVSFEPGGLHVMCIDADTFEVGDTVEVELEFADGGTMTVSAEIREE